MRNTDIEQKMYNMAIELINKRYPKGWGGAGVVRTEDDNYFTSIYLDAINPALEYQLCIETGAMMEAYKHDSRVTHSLCVKRDDEESEYEILTPCGTCQERLRFWGDRVMVGVTTPGNELMFVALAELQPYHYSTAKSMQGMEDYDFYRRLNEK